MGIAWVRHVAIIRHLLVVCRASNPFLKNFSGSLILFDLLSNQKNGFQEAPAPPIPTVNGDNKQVLLYEVNKRKHLLLCHTTELLFLPAAADGSLDSAGYSGLHSSCGRATQRRWGGL